MRFVPLGQPTTMGALHAGACFAFDWHGETMIGIKVVDDFAAHPIASCAALCPGHPERGDCPSFLDGSFGPGTGVYELCEAMIVPSAVLEDWSIGADRPVEPGGLVIARERMLLGVARPHGKVGLIDLAAGKTAQAPEHVPLLHVEGWRLVHKVFDAWETLFRFRVREAGPGALAQNGTAHRDYGFVARPPRDDNESCGCGRSEAIPPQAFPARP